MEWFNKISTRTMTPINLYLSNEEKAKLKEEAIILGKIAKKNISLSEMIRIKLFQINWLIETLQKAKGGK